MDRKGARKRRRGSSEKERTRWIHKRAVLTSFQKKKKSNVFKSTKKQKIKGIGYERISWLRLSAIF